MSTPLELLLSLQDTLAGQAISKSDYLVGMTAQVIHILGFVLLLSSVALSNLRLLGVTLKTVPVADIFWQSRRLLWIGLGLVAISGGAMFISFVKLYYFNPAFQLKIALLVLALLLQFTFFRVIGAAPQTPAWVVKSGALLSITLWFGIGLCGRAIGFV
jgi:hypothetical protein